VRWGPAINGCRACFNQSEGGPDSLLARGVSGCNVEKHLGGLWLLTVELVNQRTARSAIPESRDDVSVSHSRELITFL
jgi:hypothetical protein